MPTTMWVQVIILLAILADDYPSAHDWCEDASVEAFSLVEGGGAARRVSGGLALPPVDATLRRNPLLGEQPGHDAVHWPSQLYREEYGPGCFWANNPAEIGWPTDDVRLRRVVDLPERW